MGQAQIRVQLTPIVPFFGNTMNTNIPDWSSVLTWSQAKFMHSLKGPATTHLFRNALLHRKHCKYNEKTDRDVYRLNGLSPAYSWVYLLLHQDYKSTQ